MKRDTAREGPNQSEQREESRKEEASAGHGRVLCIIRTNTVYWEKVYDIIPRVCWNLCVMRTT